MSVRENNVRQILWLAHDSQYVCVRLVRFLLTLVLGAVTPVVSPVVGADV